AAGGLEHLGEMEAHLRGAPARRVFFEVAGVLGGGVGGAGGRAIGLTAPEARVAVERGGGWNLFGSREGFACSSCGEVGARGPHAVVIGEQRVALRQRVEMRRGGVPLSGLELGVAGEKCRLFAVGGARMIAQIILEAARRLRPLLEP